jgi:hypothetical protein
MELTLEKLRTLSGALYEVGKSIEGINEDDFTKEVQDRLEAIENTPLHIIQGNQVKKLQRIAADVEDGKIKAWELIFQEAGRK